MAAAARQVAAAIAHPTRARGSDRGGQFAYVVPSLDLVVVATTEWRGISAEGIR
jgi:hypothetical protein